MYYESTSDLLTLGSREMIGSQASYRESVAQGHTASFLFGVDLQTDASLKERADGLG